MSYLVQVQDYYGNPTSIPEIRFINMGMKMQGRARHRPQFVPLGNGYYKVTLYEVFRGDYQLNSFLWKHSKAKGIMPFDFFSVKVVPAGVDPTKSVSRTLNKVQELNAGDKAEVCTTFRDRFRNRILEDEMSARIDSYELY